MSRFGANAHEQRTQLPTHRYTQFVHRIPPAGDEARSVGSGKIEQEQTRCTRAWSPHTNRHLDRCSSATGS
jgi:hypothetical protein